MRASINIIDSFPWRTQSQVIQLMGHPVGSQRIIYSRNNEKWDCKMSNVLSIAPIKLCHILQNAAKAGNVSLVGLSDRGEWALQNDLLVDCWPSTLTKQRSCTTKWLAPQKCLNSFWASFLAYKSAKVTCNCFNIVLERNFCILARVTCWKASISESNDISLKLKAHLN